MTETLDTVPSSRRSSLALHCGALFLTALVAACASLAVQPRAHQAAFVAKPDSAEDKTADLFDRIADEPAFLQVFLRDMPKGGDLHNHLSGTPYAEEFLEWAETREFCIDVDALSIVPPPCDDALKKATRDLMHTDPLLYSKLVDAMSVRALLTGTGSDDNGHTQFFDSFDRFFNIVSVEPGKALASSRRAASEDRVLYQELMYNPGVINRHSLSTMDTDWNGDFDAAFARLEGNLPGLIAAAQMDADLAEANALAELGCEAEPEAPGCEVEVYYNCYGLRLIPNAQLFQQLALCFALIDADPRFRGVSLVQPEDNPIAVTHYDLHMRMIAYFAEKYPHAKVSLHAGELTIGLVPGYALRRHIRSAINVAGSDRIGHGVGIAFELDSRDLLTQMAEDEIAVEINLSSNAVILGIEGKEHPLNLYLASGVPIVLSTDDLGVLRSDMTAQYVKAALDHGLGYLDLKQASRNSLYYSFLPGGSYWRSADYTTPVAQCVQLESDTCTAYLEHNVKASLEAELETAFGAFETDMSDWSANFEAPGQRRRARR